VTAGARLGRAAIAALGLLVAGCASRPAPPAWQTDAATALDAFREHYLAGETRLAERSLAEARRHVSATGDPAVAARVELIRCGITTAALDFAPCQGLDEPARYGSEEDRAYAAFVTGDGRPVDRTRLPPQYRDVAGRTDAAATLQSLRAIADPLSRLVAAGALFRRSMLPPEGVAVAVDTASRQGYRRPLLAWLGIQESMARTAGDTTGADRIRRRIELAGGTRPPTRP
jgi:hypothetical protein